jgi:hypothetical protein
MLRAENLYPAGSRKEKTGTLRLRTTVCMTPTYSSDNLRTNPRYPVTMTPAKRKHLLLLCDRISKEKDGAKFTALILELDILLEGLHPNEPAYRNN